jgi:hypothetical protein
LQEAAKEKKDGKGKAGNREEIIQIRGLDAGKDLHPNPRSAKQKATNKCSQ